VYKQGRTKVKWRHGQEPSLVPHIWTQGLLGVNALIEESSCDIVGTFGSPQWFGTWSIVPPSPSLLHLYVQDQMFVDGEGLNNSVEMKYTPYSFTRIVKLKFWHSCIAENLRAVMMDWFISSTAARHNVYIIEKAQLTNIHKRK